MNIPVFRNGYLREIISQGCGQGAVKERLRSGQVALSCIGGTEKVCLYIKNGEDHVAEVGYARGKIDIVPDILRMAFNKNDLKV